MDACQRTPIQPKAGRLWRNNTIQATHKRPQHDHRGNMAPRFAQGVFLGYSRDANVYMVGTTDGIVTSRALQRRPMENRWEANILTSLQATPWEYTLRADASVELGPSKDGGQLDHFLDRVTTIPRRFRIERRDLEQYGYSQNCPQCDHVQRYAKARWGLQHTERCRSRIMASIARTPAGQER